MHHGKPREIPLFLTPISQLHQSPPSPVPGDRARGKRSGSSPSATLFRQSQYGFSVTRFSFKNSELRANSKFFISCVRVPLGPLRQIESNLPWILAEKKVGFSRANSSFALKNPIESARSILLEKEMD